MPIPEVCVRQYALVPRTYEAIQRPAVEAAYHHLGAVERFLCGGLIRRQVRVGYRLDDNVAKYGVNGALAVYRARSMQAWLIALVVPVVVLAVAQQTIAMLAVLAIGLAIAVCAIVILQRNTRLR